jgi:hypothetical protein
MPRHGTTRSRRRRCVAAAAAAAAAEREEAVFGAPCEVGNFGVGVLEAEDARLKKAPGVGLSDHLGVVARWPVRRKK